MGRVSVAWLVLAGIACGDGGGARPDASRDGTKLDVTSPVTLRIAVAGCGRYDAAGTCGGDGGVGPCCTGSPPLALSFSPVGSEELTSFRWNFGDGTPETAERAPSHAYAHSGSYEVILTGGGDTIGTVMPPEPLTVVVEPLTAGAPCDVDHQCGDGLSCMCAPGSGCSSAFVRGLCSKACDTASCGPGAVCAALAITPSAPPDAGAGTPPPICLAACQANAECAAGFVCQTLSAGSAASTAPWERGCLPLGAARDVGASCRDPNELLDPDACTTGVCADVGALGVCSAACGAGSVCPEGTACAALADGRHLCLARCTLDQDCAADPLLACEAVAPTSDDTILNVCAPRSCTGDATCAPSGRCGPDGICIRR